MSVITIKESDVLERIGAAIDELDMDGLADVHNNLTNHPYIRGDDIEPTEGWHLVPTESAH